MNSKISKVFAALLFLPMAVLLVSTSAAQNTPPARDDDTEASKVDSDQIPDLVITEDTQMGDRDGKVVKGSCEKDEPLWEGAIAIKNIGRSTVPWSLHDREARFDPLEAAKEAAEKNNPKVWWPHVRAYVPNNIQLKAEARLTYDLDYLGQELVDLSIGKGEPKCRNYGAPPIFDERLSGRPGPLRVPDGPTGGYGDQIRRIQQGLNGKGYPVHVDGDYGPETSRAVAAYFKGRGDRPPPGIHQKPLSPETVALLLDVLDERDDDNIETASPGPGYGGDDECVRGINLVPVYIEIDPERRIKNENRSNNRVQFTVAIDCSNVGRLHR